MRALGALGGLMTLAALAAAGLVSAKFSYMVAHLPTTVASDGGPFIGAGRAEGVCVVVCAGTLVLGVGTHI